MSNVDGTAGLAQSVEQVIRNDQVVGSSPIAGSIDVGKDIKGGKTGNPRLHGRKAIGGFGV